MAKTGTSDFNRYASMDFPDYEFREYPKMIYPDNKADPSKPTYANGKPSEGVTVRDENEERTVLGGGEVVDEEDVRARLILEADAKGVKIDKRWATDKIVSAIAVSDAAAAAAERAIAEARA